MSRVGEAHRRDVGVERLATGFPGGAGLLSGLRRMFNRHERDFAPGPIPVAAEGAAPSVGAVIMDSGAPLPTGDSGQSLDDVDRFAAHLAGAACVGRARRILITHAPSGDAPLAALDCAAFASQLARSLAGEGRAILVVFGAGGGMRPGLSELIDGSASFSEAIHREAGSRLHILPSGRGRAAPGAGLDVVLDALCDTYDFVILSATEEERDALRRLSLSLAPRADHVLLGCAGQTGSPDMLALRDAMKDEGAGEVMLARIGQAPSLSRAAA